MVHQNMETSCFYQVTYILRKVPPSLVQLFSLENVKEKKKEVLKDTKTWIRILSIFHAIRKEINIINGSFYRTSLYCLKLNMNNSNKKL